MKGLHTCWIVNTGEGLGKFLGVLKLNYFIELLAFVEPQIYLVIKSTWMSACTALFIFIGAGDVELEVLAGGTDPVDGPLADSGSLG
jgi:hypothetical protein